MDTKHPHRGFDHLWYLLAGEVPTIAPVQVARWSVRGCRPDRS
jgi:hypothetical protein